MSFINIEIKAKTNSADKIRSLLLKEGAEFLGTDLQTDTYFNVPTGRLKLREGNIENNLIFYKRNNLLGPKQSDFSVSPVTDPLSLKEILTESLGIRVIVKKRREIYYIDNVKFHLDSVEDLGEFVEIEAGNKITNHSTIILRKQCDYYVNLFEISENDLLASSYSDMLSKT